MAEEEKTILFHACLQSSKTENSHDSAPTVPLGSKAPEMPPARAVSEGSGCCKRARRKVRSILCSRIHARGIPNAYNQKQDSIGTANTRRRSSRIPWLELPRRSWPRGDTHRKGHKCSPITGGNTRKREPPTRRHQSPWNAWGVQRAGESQSISLPGG